MSHLLSCLQIFLGKYEYFFLSIPAFIKQGLQHSHTQHEGDAELPRAHFNTQLPGQGALPGRRGGRGYLLWAVPAAGSVGKA